MLPKFVISSRAVSSLSVDLAVLMSALNTPVEFTFRGFGVVNGDEALFVGSNARSDEDCYSEIGTGGSSSAFTSGGKATFVFSSAVERLNVCYKFGNEPFRLYKSLPVIDIGVAVEEEEEVFVEAAAEVTLSLAGSVDTIPAGSPARAK